MSLKRNILDLRKRKEIVLQGGGEDAIKKQAAMGKLTARERTNLRILILTRKFFTATVSLSVPVLSMENPLLFMLRISLLQEVR